MLLKYISPNIPIPYYNMILDPTIIGLNLKNNNKMKTNKF